MLKGLGPSPSKRSIRNVAAWAETFVFKNSDFSNENGPEKAENVLATEADYLRGGDMGCLMNMAGKLTREGHKEIEALHTAEVLAGLAPQILGGKNASK